MMRYTMPVALGFAVLGFGCHRGSNDNDDGASSVDPPTAEAEAITHLRERGYDVYEEEEGLEVVLTDVFDEPYGVTKEDVKAVNSLTNIHEFRIINFEGIPPEVFKEFRTFPKVTKVTVHYQMPAESIAYFDRFPNVEELSFWADQYISCDQLPVFPALRIFDHESDDGQLSMEAIRRLAKCRNLEEIQILTFVSQKGIELLKSLPKLRELDVNYEQILPPVGEEGGAD